MTCTPLQSGHETAVLLRFGLGVMLASTEVVGTEVVGAGIIEDEFVIVANTVTEGYRLGLVAGVAVTFGIGKKAV